MVAARGDTPERVSISAWCVVETQRRTREKRARWHTDLDILLPSFSLYCFKLTHLADDPAVVVGSSSGGLVLLRSYAVDALPPPSLLLLLLLVSRVPLLAVFSRHTTSSAYL